MTLPGVVVTSRESQAASSAETDTGTAFFTGLAERGPSDRAVLCRNLAQVEATFGDRSGGQTLYDAADVFFREGGSRLYIGRVFGPSPSVATVTEANSAKYDAVNPGAWGADIDVVVTAGTDAGQFVYSVQYQGTEVENSGDLNDIAEAVAWSADSDYIRVSEVGSANDPAVGTKSLVGGTDDRTNAVESNWTAALVLFTQDKGPGQVAAPGRTTTAAHTALVAHAKANNRHALIDLADTSTVSTLTTEVANHRTDGRYAEAFAPWAVVPGIAEGTERTVPYSAVQAGMIARSEGVGNSPNVAVAGDNGRSLYAIDLSQSPWTDAQREVLNDAGVNVAIVRDGGVRTYGARTLVNALLAPGFLQAPASRTVMGLTSEAQAVGEGFLFSQIDGKGRKLAEFQGALQAICADYYDDGALYGETLQDAARVDVGSQVNPPEDLAQGILRAVIAVRVSPFAERVVIEITKVANTEVIA